MILQKKLDTSRLNFLRDEFSLNIKSVDLLHLLCSLLTRGVLGLGGVS